MPLQVVSKVPAGTVLEAGIVQIGVHQDLYLWSSSDPRAADSATPTDRNGYSRPFQASPEGSVSEPPTESFAHRRVEPRDPKVSS